MNDIKKIFGIDSLYYFAESNEDYEDLFLDILDQLEEIKGRFAKREIEHENNDINITIKDISLQYLGKNEGFYWFKDFHEFFRIGFKDKTVNRGLNDIRVQLQGVGIYTIGIKSLLEFINDNLLNGYVTDYFPITRADLNCFIQYDFSFVTKEMFATRKRKYATISEIGSATTTQTIYVGKEPFKLRLYNKKEELKKSKKKDLMYEYFTNHDFNMDDDIFNIEFELHRTHLKQYSIQTVKDLLCNAQKLFKQSMDDIRLIDISNITDKDIKNNSKSRASTLLVWEYIKNSYKLDDFLQTSLGLERIKRAISLYDDNKFATEYVLLLRKAFINNVNIDLPLLETLFKEAKESLKKTTSTKEIKKKYRDVEYFDKNGKKTMLRWLDNGDLIKPLNILSVSKLPNYELHRYYESTLNNIHLSQFHNDLHHIAQKEMLRRELLPNFSQQSLLVDEEVNEYGF